MATHGTGTFEGTRWEEHPFSEIDGGPPLSRASVTNLYKGDVEGEGTLEYLTMYRADGTCPFVGAERIVGRVGDRTGSFVLRHEGVYENETATTTLTVVPGCGTGDLAGLRGEGTFAAKHGETPVPLTLDYWFE